MKSKSIFVIDTPENCIKCHLTYNDSWDATHCSLTGEYIGYYGDNKSPYCPLSPLPLHKDLAEYVNAVDGSLDKILACQYAQGWNDCREEILKGEK